MQESHLLVTRFTIPPLRTHLLPRTPLIEHLNQSCSLPLMLLSAGAGFGKTTLLAAWANQSPHPVAWLSLDHFNNDPQHFWRMMIAALRTRLPTVGAAALAQLQIPQPPHLIPLLTSLINELAALGEEMVLILDDYHVIEEQTIHESLVFLLDHAPSCLHLAIASRIDPPLPLSRWRVRGQMAEIRDAGLRLSEGETGSFLREVMGVQLRKEEVTQLAARTEGWIAGLQLAALSLRGHADPSAFVKALSGNQRFILDYVQEEILLLQPPAIQRFLMQTAILTRMNAALCQAVTGEQASQALLETLERANLFLVPLDEERQWYRLHDLFREALLACLHTMQPEMIPILHQRAAGWYEAQEEWHQAISHWLLAKDFSSAARLMEQTARQFWLGGEVRIMAHWVMKLPNAVVREYARLALTSALYLLISEGAQWRKGPIEAEQLMEQVEIVLQKSEEGTRLLASTDVRLLEQRLRLLRAWSRAVEPLVRGDREQFRLIFQQMQALEQEDDVVWQMLPLSVSFIFHYVFQREAALLVPRFQDAWQQANQSGYHFVMIKVSRWLTLAYLCAGRLHLAYQECLVSFDLLEQIEGPAVLAAYCFMNLALVLYQWNRLEEARTALQQVIHEAAVWQHIELLEWGYRTLVKVELAAGNLVAARQTAMPEAEHLTHRLRDVFHQSWGVATRVRWWLAVGNLAEAGSWAAQVVFRQDSWEPYRAEEFLALLRVYLAQAEYAQAVEAIERFRSHLDRTADMTITIEFLSLSAVALHQAGMRVQARSTVARLLALTAPEGHIRVYLDAGEPMKRILQSFLDASQDRKAGTTAAPRAYISTLLAAFEQEEQVRSVRSDAQSAHPPMVSPPIPQRLSGSAAGTPALLEPLTPQEQRVLHLLAEGASNQQIASQLVISLVTVKKHMTNLLGKLGAANRTQAVVRAQAYGLL